MISTCVLGWTFDRISCLPRISYVHRTAYFRMYTQLKKQSAAFIRGFHLLVDKQWMASFSPNELQRLISGDHVDLDVDDLRYV